MCQGKYVEITNYFLPSHKFLFGCTQNVVIETKDPAN